MRTFVAVDIGDDVRDELGGLIEQLKDSIDARSGEMKWIRPDSVHLTLKFLGEVGDNDIVSVCEVVEKVVEKYEHFYVELGSVGSFGNPPRVIWVGINDSDGILTKMADEIERELFNIGFDKEGKKFKPHLTLCRIKSVKAGWNTKDVLPEFADYEGPEMSVETVSVYHSKLKPKGAEYTAIKKAELK